ncbi:MAG TPA: tRNA (adenosine(37)-N6)-threonylcarbamoyltransferase complex transferase subunit TsaD [Candidatus Paceibacterota bacterium]
MIILGVETSCDETALSVIESVDGEEITVWADKTISQAKLHAKHGGVFPNLAKREHLTNLPLMLPSVLTEAGLSAEKPEIDAIAVTVGPGLEPCLWTGITFAETLAKKWGVHIIPVNHMEGHIFSALLRRENEIQETRFKIQEIKFPALALLISGGHTELVLIRDWFKYEIIGQTRDDAVGEAFDKVARLLGLPYPGGPPLSALAAAARGARQSPTLESGKRSDLVLPRPMLHSGDFDFSFSGLKTAVLYLLKEIGTPDEKTKAAIAREFEDAVTEVLIAKTKAALEQYGATTLLIGGGVIANTHIRRAFERFVAEMSVPLFIPERNLTTDNALMIAATGMVRLLKGGKPESGALKAQGNLRLAQDEDL